MKCRGRRGFTLVELLVVITIIGMLVALLVPAVMAARESARRTTCINNQSNILKAAITYEGQYNRFPPIVQRLGQGEQAEDRKVVSWLVPLFPYLEQNNLYERIVDKERDLYQRLYIEWAVCPSDPPVSPGDGDGPFAYVGNRRVFHPERRVSLEWISGQDGAVHTMLISETLEEHQWGERPTTAPADSPEMGRVYFDVEPEELQEGSGIKMSKYLSSNHGGGVVVGFCGGNVRFMRDTLPMHIYGYLVTPDGEELIDDQILE